MSLIDSQWPPTAIRNELAPTRSWTRAVRLDLEAPAVALVWQLLLARWVVSPSSLFDEFFDPAHALLLAIPVWLVYCADRLGDGWRKPELIRLTRRHQDHAVLRGHLAWLWPSLLALCLTVSMVTLSGRQWLVPLGLTLASLGYFALVQNRGAAGRWFRQSPGPKEATIGLLFAAGVGVFPLTAANQAAAAEPISPMSPGLVAAALMSFGLLCSSNCLLIRLAELPPVAIQKRQTIRTMLVAQLSFATLAAGLLLIRGIVFWPAASLLATACLLLVWKALPQLSARRSRLLADLSLAAPVALLLF